jgi:hypothetical protein
VGSGQMAKSKVKTQKSKPAGLGALLLPFDFFVLTFDFALRIEW